MQIAYIVCDSKTGKTSIVLEEFITPQAAMLALDRFSHYHELEYGVEKRGVKEKFGGKTAITLIPKRWIKELPEIIFDSIKSVAKVMEAELRTTDEKILKTLEEMFASPAVLRAHAS